ncbi:MAG: SDR family oxidoreductase [Tepidisphaeraceae bacterium]|jgi:pteridine reductase
MTQRNKKRVALVTGAAKRVGRAIALRLAEAGFDVAFTYFHSEDLANNLVMEIRKMGSHALAIRADLTDPESAIPAITAGFLTAFRRLDVLVNNASLYEPDTEGPDALSRARRLWAIHVESPMLLSRKCAPRLKAAGGCIVNMLDLLAERPMPGYLAYCASKAALWNLTLGLARELAPEVRVNGIAPGVVQWPQDLPLQKRAQYLRRVPLARAGTPADVAQAVLFLCTDGPYITGQILRLDGGRSIT